MAHEILNDRDHQHHSSWIAHVIERIEEAIEDIDIDFPLSGGEDHPHHKHRVHHTHHSHTLTEEELAEDKNRRHQHWKLDLFHHIDTDFPLSGG